VLNVDEYYFIKAKRIFIFEKGLRRWILIFLFIKEIFNQF